MRKSILAAAMLLGTVWAPLAMAQTATTLGGTVSDSSGALIPGVTITATNVGTGIVTTVYSNESGAYQFANLQPGTYKVSGELSGFQTKTYDTGC
jgi:protocatechuate 3,4-dioxygenase beta subunit